MKKIYAACLFLSFLLPAESEAQSEDAVFYTGVIEVPGATREELFVKGRQWLSETFNTARYYMYIEDRETGELTGRGNIWVDIYFGIFRIRRSLTFCPMTFNIWVKDGKFKYRFTDFQVDMDTVPATFPFRLSTATQSSQDFYGGGKSYRQLTKELGKSVDEQMAVMISSLEAKMAGSASTDF